MRKFNVTVNGIQYEVSIEETQSFAPKAAPATAYIPVTSVAPVSQAESKSNAIPPTPVAAPQSAAEGTKLSAPMPGTLLKFSVPEGSQVKKGQVVCVLEAMKMANDIVSPADGIIKYLLTEGSNVSSGDDIAVIS